PAASDDIELVTDEAEEAAGIELAIPTASEKRGGALIKRVLAKVSGWYHAFLVQQIVRFAGAVVGALRVMGVHVEPLERATGHAVRADDEANGLPVPAHAPVVAAPVVDALRGVTGRVLVAEAGEGDLLATITGVGVDAYGVEPRFVSADAAVARGLEVRN